MDPIKTKLLAQVPHNLGGLSGPGITPVGDGTSQLEKIISNVIGIITVVAVIYFVFQIIFAGYEFFQTEGDSKKMEIARKRLTEGVMGLFIVVIALGIGSLIASLTGLGNVLDLGNFINTNLKFN